MGERYKGWISWPPLLVHSSVDKLLVLAYMPRDPKGGYLFHGTTRLNFLVYSGVGKHLVLASSLAFHAEGVLHHGTTRLNFIWVELCGYTWV